MDETDFDSLIRSLATPTRRGLLAALAAALGGRGGDADGDAALAKRAHRVDADRLKKNKRKKRGTIPTSSPPSSPPPPCAAECADKDEGRTGAEDRAGTARAGCAKSTISAPTATSPLGTMRFGPTPRVRQRGLRLRWAGVHLSQRRRMPPHGQSSMRRTSRVLHRSLRRRRAH